MKVGYKDPKETSKELFEERRREEILEEKIRELRSERDKQEGKKRAPQRSGNPKKKLKYETKNNETLGIEKKGGNSALTFTTQQLEKRKQVRPANTSAPKRVKMDMRRYVLVRQGTDGVVLGHAAVVVGGGGKLPNGGAVLEHEDVVVGVGDESLSGGVVLGHAAAVVVGGGGKLPNGGAVLEHEDVVVGVGDTY